MATAGVEGQIDAMFVIVPKQRIFHLVAVKIGLIIGNTGIERGEFDFGLAKRLFDQSGFGGKFEIKSHNLPGRGG